MKSKYYYGWCYYEELSDPLRKWYKIHASDTIILYNKYKTDGVYYMLVEIRAIKKKLDWKVYEKAL